MILDVKRLRALNDITAKLLFLAQVYNLKVEVFLEDKQMVFSIAIIELEGINDD